MKKWRLFIKEVRHTVFEVEANTPEEGARICLTEPGKGRAKLGMIEATIEGSQEITTEEPTVKAAKKFDPLDKSYGMN